MLNFIHEIPTNGRTPSTHEYWGFHMAKLNSRQGRRTKKYTYEIAVAPFSSWHKVDI
jgi:hypothetical protein